MSDKIKALVRELEGLDEDYNEYLNDEYERRAIPHRANYNSEIEYPDFVYWTQKNCITFEDWLRECREYCDLVPIVLRSFEAFRELKSL